MILVDTSIWIRFLAGKEPYARELDRLLAHEEVLGHPFVYGELFMGDLGSRTKLLATYAEISQAGVARHGDVVELVRSRNLHGRGIGWVDAHLLASTLLEHSLLFTADERLAGVASTVGVAYVARRS